MDIKIMGKPNCISYDVIHNILWYAHESTRLQGMNYKTSQMSGAELQSYLTKKNGITLVAMDGEVPIGTTSFYIDVQDGGLGMKKLRLAHVCFSGILPAYKGMHIYAQLMDKYENMAREFDCDGLYFGTNAKNKKMRQLKLRNGYILTRYFYKEDTGQFSIGGVKLFSALPRSKWNIKVVFVFRMVKARMIRIIKRNHIV